MSIEYRSLQLQELEKWTELCATGFEKESASYFHRHFVNDPDADVNGIFVAVDGDSFVSSVRVFTRRIHLLGEEVRAAFLGEVCTVPAYRGQGHSSRLIQLAIEYMASHDLPLCLLFTGVNHHYAHQGWFTLMRRHVRLDLAAEPALPAGVTLRPVTAADHPALRALYRQHMALPATLVRSDAYWDKWVTCELHDAVALEQDGNVVSYLAYEGEPNGRMLVREWVLGPTMSRELALQMLAATARQGGFAPQALVAEALLPGASVDYDEWDDMMARLNRPFTVAGRRIDSSGALAAALADATYFETDGC